MDDTIARRTAVLLAGYQTRRLQLDGIITVAYQLGFEDQDVRALIERLADEEQGETRLQRLTALLVRAYRNGRLGIDELLPLSEQLGVDEEQRLAILDACGEIELARRAA